MAIVTVVPDGTLSNSMTLTGAATAHAAVSDGLDSSYIQAPWGSFSTAYFHFGNYTIPAGNMVQQVRVRLRYRTIDPTGFANITSWYHRLVSGAPQTAGPQVSHNYVSAVAVDETGAWVTKTPNNTAWTQAEVNELRIEVYSGYWTGNVEMPRIYQIYLDLDVRSNPVGVITAPANNATITDTNRPPHTFTYSDADGDPFGGYRIRIFSAAQYNAVGWDGTTSPATFDTGKVVTSFIPASVIPNVDLLNSTTYKSFLWVYSQGATGDWIGPGVSAPVANTYTLNLTPPAVPTLTRTAYSDHIDVVVTTGGGTPASTSAVLERSTDEGLTWVVVRGTPQALSTSFTVNDYEATPNRSIIYRARAFSSLSIASNYSASTTAAIITDNEWRLKDPLNPVTYNIILAVIGSSMTQTKNEDKAFYNPLGRTRKVSVSDTLKGEESTLSLEFLTEAAWVAFEVMRNLQRTLLLTRGWTGEQFYINFTEARQMELFNYTPTYRQVTIGWIEADIP